MLKLFLTNLNLFSTRFTHTHTFNKQQFIELNLLRHQHSRTHFKYLELPLGGWGKYVYHFIIDEFLLA